MDTETIFLFFFCCPASTHCCKGVICTRADLWRSSVGNSDPAQPLHCLNPFETSPSPLAAIYKKSCTRRHVCGSPGCLLCWYVCAGLLLATIGEGRCLESTAGPVTTCNSLNNGTSCPQPGERVFAPVGEGRDRQCSLPCPDPAARGRVQPSQL